jgi:hypothetical protein
VGASTSGMGSGVSGGVAGVAAQSSGYQGQQARPLTTLLGAQLDNAEQDPISYGNVYPPSSVHNGTNDETY